MAITGISAISGEQLIAAGALSARSAGTASYTTGGNDIQGLYNTVSDNSASWTGGGSVSITSPSGTIFVTDGDKVEGTNSAVRIGIVEQGYRSNDKTIDFWQTGISSDAYSDAFRILPSPNVRPFNSKIVFSGLGQNVGNITLTVTGYNSAWEVVTAYSTFNDNGQLQQIEANLSGIDEQVGIMASDVIYFQGGYDTWYVSADAVYGPTGIGELAWNSAVTNVVNTVSSNSASWGGGASYTGDAQGALDEVYSNSGTWNTVTDKLNTTAFSTVSGNFLTAHQSLTGSANWDSTYNTVSDNSASWTGGGGSSDTFFAEYGVTTFNEIWSAATAGKAVYAYTQPVTTATETIDCLQLTYIEKYSDSNAKACFVQTLESNNTIYTNIATVNSYNTWGFNGYHGNYVPEPSYNSGYVLTEDGLGNYSWAAPAGGADPFPVEIKTGNTLVGVITTGFQDNTATRPTLFISGTTATNNYPRMLLSENHAAAQTSKSGAFLSDAFEFYTGKNGSSTKILRIDSTGMSGNAGFVFNKANHDKWNGVYNTVSSNSGSWTGGGASYTGDVQGALDEVYTNSATWLASLDVNNIVLTASLPGTPDTGTLYLIPET